MNNALTQLTDYVSQAFTWGNGVGIAFTAASMAVALIQFIYWRS
jgi:hypothetical protein